MEFFREAESVLQVTIPLYIKNLLIINGYDTGPVITAIAETDLNAIEKFARCDLLNYISNDTLSEFYGPTFCTNTKSFIIVPGHRRLIFILKDVFVKTYAVQFDKSTMTDIDKSSNLSVHSEVNNHLKKTHASTAKTKGTIQSDSNSDSNLHQINLLTVNLTDENALIYKTLKSWAVAKCNKVTWSNIPFDNIKIATSLNSDQSLISSVTCFCGQTYIISQASRKPTCKPRWPYGNFHRHFLKAHIEETGVSNESPEIQVELNALDYPNVKKQPIEVSVLSVTDDMTNKIDQRFNNESAKETTPPSTILSMDYSETDSYVYCGNENLDLNKKTTDCQSASCSKWSTLKYSRDERKCQKREKFNENQSLITSFFPVIDCRYASEKRYLLFGGIGDKSRN
ncbi:hypothetical protein FQA39_LY18045 [Lamprigera yunnana]|nr:hypothetical protein FQA39_LY18045 [Lamprigera yunnana]